MPHPTVVVTGPQGLRGVQGTSGVNGLSVRGMQGNTGTPGLRGSQGIPGTLTRSAGPQGRGGAQGHIGYHGTQGKHGEIGQHGRVGHQGTEGPLGFQGIVGDVGPRGHSGFGVQGLVGEKGTRGTQGPESKPTRPCFESFGSELIYERKSSSADPIHLHYALPVGEHYLRFSCQLHTPEIDETNNNAATLNPCCVKVTLHTAGISRITSCRLKRFGTQKQLSIELADAYMCTADHARVTIDVESVFLQHIPVHISHCSFVVFSKELTH